MATLTACHRFFACASVLIAVLLFSHTGPVNALGSAPLNFFKSSPPIQRLIPRNGLGVCASEHSLAMQDRQSLVRGLKRHESVLRAAKIPVEVAVNTVPTASALLRIITDKLTAVKAALANNLNFRDATLIAALWFGAVPIARFIYERWLRPSKDEAMGEEKMEFGDSYLFHAADHVRRGARVGGLVVLTDCLLLSLNAMGITTAKRAGISRTAGIKITYTVWAVNRLRVLNRYLVGRAAQKESDNLGRAKMYCQALDYLVYFVGFLNILDILSINVSLALKSVFAVGGLGTVVASLATKDLAAELVNGMALFGSERYYEGDYIRLGDGTSGYVTNMGPLATEIRGQDELTTKIPHSILAKQRISNLSRVTKCQVKQTLFFQYKDIKKIPSILSDIKEEIKKSCPKLIVDGSRPFRATWRDYGKENVEILVKCHFDIKPSGDVYWNNRQAMLEAIARAVEKNGAEFALPILVNVSQ